MLRKLSELLLLTPLLLIAPILGVWLAGNPVADYLQFPPQPVVKTSPCFSWPIFWMLVLMEVPIYILTGKALRCYQRQGRLLFPWPPWGWLSLIWLMSAWYLAWKQPGWAGPLLKHTFFLLWLGYIGVVNALCVRYRGWSLVTHHTRYLLGLFPLSAFFWWYFEYLNRFVHNWYYLGTSGLSPWSYFWQASLPFSTVLPAVASTIVFLYAFFAPTTSAKAARTTCTEGLTIRRGPLQTFTLSNPRKWAWSGLFLGSISLVGVGLWPQWFFPFLWGAPLILFVSIQALLGEPTYFRHLKPGRWDVIVVPMVAGLICGFFWEMWNFWSDPKWIYSVPWVGRFKLFEMPLLGYAGYLPFGLECAVVAEWWGRKSQSLFE